MEYLGPILNFCHFLVAPGSSLAAGFLQFQTEEFVFPAPSTYSWHRFWGSLWDSPWGNPLPHNAVSDIVLTLLEVASSAVLIALHGCLLSIQLSHPRRLLLSAASQDEEEEGFAMENEKEALLLKGSCVALIVAASKLLSPFIVEVIPLAPATALSLA